MLGGGLSSVLAETRWLESSFSRLKQSYGEEQSCEILVIRDKIPVVMS